MFAMRGVCGKALRRMFNAHIEQGDAQILRDAPDVGAAAGAPGDAIRRGKAARDLGRHGGVAPVRLLEQQDEMFDGFPEGELSAAKPPLAHYTRTSTPLAGRPVARAIAAA